jgi:hypothetical protein
VRVTVTVQYGNRKSIDVVVPLSERATETRVALEGPLRSVDIG